MNREQLILIKIAEEASEVAKEALKASQFGLDSKHPDKDETNLENMLEEFTDLYAMICQLCKETSTPLLMNQEKVREKQARVEKFAMLSQKLGRVNWTGISFSEPMKDTNYEVVVKTQHPSPLVDGTLLNEGVRIP